MKPKAPKLPESLRNRIVSIRRSLKSYSEALRAADAEPTGSNIRRYRLVDANNEAISATNDVMHLFRHTEHALAEGPFTPVSFVIPRNLQSAELNRAVADIRSIVADLEDNYPGHARATAINLLGRICDVFGLPR